MTAAAKAAYPAMKTFEEWAKRGRSSKREMNWNEVTVGRLVSGKQ